MIFKRAYSLGMLALSIFMASQGTARSVKLVERCDECQAVPTICQQVQNTPAYSKCGSVCQPLGTQFSNCLSSSDLDATSSTLGCLCMVKDPCNKCHECLANLEVNGDSQLKGYLSTFEEIGAAMATTCPGGSGSSGGAKAVTSSTTDAVDTTTSTHSTAASTQSTTEASSVAVPTSVGTTSVDTSTDTSTDTESVVAPIVIATKAEVSAVSQTSAVDLQPPGSGYTEPAVTKSVGGDVASGIATTTSGYANLQTGGTTKICKSKTGSTASAISTATGANSLIGTGGLAAAAGSGNKSADCGCAEKSGSQLWNGTATSSGKSTFNFKSATNGTSGMKVNNGTFAASASSSASPIPDVSLRLFRNTATVLVVAIVPFTFLFLV